MSENSHGVVCRKMRGLEWSKVREEGPVPGGDQHILALDVAMLHASLMCLTAGVQQLEGYPQLHSSIQSECAVE